jgi:predicted RNA methylase
MDELARVMMTIGCGDCDPLMKVADAGRILPGEGGPTQIMHNGLRVTAGGYYGDWMAHIIRALRGHHEPQEERLFAELLRYARHGSLFVELGSFWAYYSLWFLHEIPGSRALCVEPDPANMAVGRRNAALNGMEDRVTFVEAWVGDADRELPTLNMAGAARLMADHPIEILHIDAQGAELPFLCSMSGTSARPRFVVVSSHHRLISGSATTHEDCIAMIETLGGFVLAEHSVQESFSGDGLIVASFAVHDRSIVLPEISRNRTSLSLFPEP